jgi:hypothetical protein
MLQDKTGTPFGAQIYQRAKDDEITEVIYLSPVPGSTEGALKRAYVARVGDQVCGVSVYGARHHAD